MVSSFAAIIALVAATSYLAAALLQTRSLLNSTEVRSTHLVGLSTGGVILHGIANYLVIYAGETLNFGI